MIVKITHVHSEESDGLHENEYKIDDKEELDNNDNLTVIFLKPQINLS